MSLHMALCLCCFKLQSKGAGVLPPAQVVPLVVLFIQWLLTLGGGAGHQQPPLKPPLKHLLFLVGGKTQLQPLLKALLYPGKVLCSEAGQTSSVLLSEDQRKGVGCLTGSHSSWNGKVDGQ